MSFTWTEKEFDSFLQFLQEKRSLDFAGYKRPSVERRVARRLELAGVERLEEYMDLLEADPDEFIHLLNTLLINVTSFFRDPQAWEYLAKDVLPHIVAAKDPEAYIRVWSAGCASGEEAYSLAMLLAEALEPARFRRRVKIYGTDIDEHALSEARMAAYTQKQLENVPAEIRAKYFQLKGEQYVFDPELRRSVIFGRHNLLSDAPISNLDLLLCRNTMMYFNAEAQRRVVSLLHFSLNNDGFLFLGKAEMLFAHGQLFAPADLKYRVFRKVPTTPRRLRLADAIAGVGRFAPAPSEEAGRLRETASEVATAAELIVDEDSVLISANAAARDLLGLRREDLGRDLHELAGAYLPVDLRPRLEQAYALRRAVSVPALQHADPTGRLRYFDVIIAPLSGASGDTIGASVTFTETTRYRDLQAELERSREEVQAAYEELQSTHEELETTNEELQSSNEELETTNEELQSSNEEMETMNEELRSSNEELRLTNDRMHEVGDDVNRLNAFLGSILASLDVAVVVVDRTLAIQVWNHHAENLWGLRSDEVVDEFLHNLDIGLSLEQMSGALRRVATGESEREETVLEATNRRGKQIQCRVCCTPLKDLRGELQGAVVTMEEVGAGAGDGRASQH